MNRAALLSLVLLTAIAAGCGSSSGSSSSPAATTTELKAAAAVDARPAPTGPRIKVVDSEFGRVIADGKGEALYLFDKERRRKAKCYGTCASAWPPVLAKGAPVAGAGADQALLGTTRRANGKLQVTYAGQPLYYYVADTPGTILCHDVFEYGGNWYVVQPDGAPAA
jgi:predicted lipoprotein with Yx(FWY)xxD motif